MDLTNVLIDLEILKQLKENDKLGVTILPGFKKLTIVSSSNIQSMIRWYNGFNRDKSIVYIESLIDKIENLTNMLVKGNHINTINSLKDSISAANNGLQILKTTYSNDPVTFAKISILINRFKSIVESLDQHSRSENNNINMV